MNISPYIQHTNSCTKPSLLQKCHPLPKQSPFPPFTMSQNTKAVVLIITNETLEKMSSIGATSLLYFFLTGVFNLPDDQALTINFLFSGITNLVPVVGAILSDSFFGRFTTLSFSTPCSLLGVLLLTLTALPGMHPGRPEASPQAWQMALLYTSFLFFTLGAAGIRSCNLPFGIDQYDLTTEAGKRGKEKFISWNYASFTLSVMLAVIVIPVVQAKTNSWVVGFLIPASFMLLSCILFFAGSPLYIKTKPQGSPVVSVMRVFVASFRNRNLPLSNGSDDQPSDVYPTNQLRFLEKAAIITGEDGEVQSPWKLCSIRQVEEAKSVVRVTLMWTPVIIYQMVAAEVGNYGNAQAEKMDTRVVVGSINGQFPAATMPIFSSLSLTAWVLIYEKVIVPFMAKKKRSSNSGGVFPSTLLRMGVGMLFSTLGTAVAGIVEGKRRRFGGGRLSIFWQVPQRVLTGLAEGLNNPAQIDFYHGELPANISSLTGAFFAMGYAFGNFTSALLDAVVRGVTGSPSAGGKTWLPKAVDDGRLDYYFFLLAGLAAVNLGFYVLLAKWYKNKLKNVTVK